MSDETKKKIIYYTIKCPYCTKEGNIGPMKRWHFDNCKVK